MGPARGTDRNGSLQLDQLLTAVAGQLGDQITCWGRQRTGAGGGESAVGGDDLLLGKGNPTAQAAADAESSAKTQNGQGTRHAGRQALLFYG
jgi:hypothetical protein